MGTKIKAIILAGGRGSRLDKYTLDKPKCMLNFNFKPLIEWQVELLRKCRINDITIVKGYMSDKIQIPNTKTYIIEDFKNTNMVEGLFVAEQELKGDILVCYADIIYEKRVLEKILGSKVDIGVNVDSDYKDYWSARFDDPKTDIESLVIDNQGKITKIGETNCSLDKAKFRYVGLIKFSEKGTRRLVDTYHKNRDYFKKAYMTDMLQMMINNGCKIDPIVIKRGWLEFDTNEDYEKYNQWLKGGSLRRFFRINKC